jgi:hypothetical protein
MPYIDPKMRPKLDIAVQNLYEAMLEVNHEAICTTDAQPGSLTDGIVNYSVTRLLHLMYGRGLTTYQDINRAVGVIECIKQEYYRRVASPYEDTKIKQNGDV